MWSGADRSRGKQVKRCYSKWFKEFDKVDKFNKWNNMMCIANVYFFKNGNRKPVVYKPWRCF